MGKKLNYKATIYDKSNNLKDSIKLKMLVDK